MENKLEAVKYEEYGDLLEIKFPVPFRAVDIDAFFDHFERLGMIAKIQYYLNDNTNVYRGFSPEELRRIGASERSNFLSCSGDIIPASKKHLIKEIRGYNFHCSCSEPFGSLPTEMQLHVANLHPVRTGISQQEFEFYRDFNTEAKNYFEELNKKE